MSGVKGRSGTNPNSKNNLKPINENVSHEGKVEAGRKGGIASGESRRRKKEMREMIQDIFEIGIKKGKVVDEINSLEDAKGKNLTVGQALILAQVKKAMAGDTKAMEFLRDTMGQKPTNKQEITATVTESPLTSILEQLKGDDEDEEEN